MREKLVKFGKAKARNYTKEEKDFIKENYKTISCKEISEVLNRSPESIRAIANTMGVSSSNVRPVVQLDLKMNFIERFESLRKAGNQIGKSKADSIISKCASGKLKNAYGYIWMYEEDYKKMIAESEVM